jgi:hypothetical protein
MPFSDKLKAIAYISSIVGSYIAIQKDLRLTKKDAQLSHLFLCLCPFLNTLIWITDSNNSLIRIVFPHCVFI